jgi:hypothetical protein
LDEGNFIASSMSHLRAMAIPSPDTDVDTYSANFRIHYAKFSGEAVDILTVAGL